MNDFTVKKLAEVQAFCLLSNDILTRSGQPFKDSASTTEGIVLSVAPFNTEGIFSDTQQVVFSAKVDKTFAKLTTMMELYIGDEWGNPTEVLEWLSFYSGAASAHAALALSALQAREINDTAEIIAHRLDLFESLLISVKQQLAQIGANKSKA